MHERFHCKAIHPVCFSFRALWTIFYFVLFEIGSIWMKQSWFFTTLFTAVSYRAEYIVTLVYKEELSDTLGDTYLKNFALLLSMSKV